MAIYNNSAWKINMSQSDEAVDNARRLELLPDNANLMEALKTIKTMKGFYSELIVRGDSGVLPGAVSPGPLFAVAAVVSGRGRRGHSLGRAEAGFNDRAGSGLCAGPAYTSGPLPADGGGRRMIDRVMKNLQGSWRSLLFPACLTGLVLGLGGLGLWSYHRGLGTPSDPGAGSSHLSQRASSLGEAVGGVRSGRRRLCGHRRSPAASPARVGGPGGGRLRGHRRRGRLEWRARRHNAALSKASKPKPGRLHNGEKGRLARARGRGALESRAPRPLSVWLPAGLEYDPLDDGALVSFVSVSDLSAWRPW